MRILLNLSCCLQYIAWSWHVAYSLSSCVIQHSHPSVAEPGAQLMENHAITLIGYDANQENWLAKNSWGEGFADKGFFRVHFNSSGKLGMCNPAETFGLVFKPEKRLQSPLGLKPAPGRSGCFLYTAQPADYISKVAVLFGMQVHQLLLDNEDTVSDLDAPIEGKTLVVCNASALLPPTATAATNSAPPTTVSGALTTSTGRTITQAEGVAPEMRPRLTAAQQQSLQLQSI